MANNCFDCRYAERFYYENGIKEVPEVADCMIDAEKNFISDDADISNGEYGIDCKYFSDILTAKQRMVYEYIVMFIKTNQYPPSIRDIAEFFEITNHCVLDYLTALINKKKIVVEKGKSRAITLLDYKVVLVKATA